MDIDLEVRRFRTFVGHTRGLDGSLERTQPLPMKIGDKVTIEGFPGEFVCVATPGLSLVHDESDGLAPWLAHNDRVTR